MKTTIMVGKIHLLRFLFLVAASRNSSEENYLGVMSRSNLKKIDMEELLKALLDEYIPVLNAHCKKTKVVGDSEFVRIIGSGHSLCPVRHRSPFFRVAGSM